MVFSSTVFVFLFLPVVITGHFLLPRRWRNGWLFLASIWFYCWGEMRYFPLIVASSVLDYCCGLVISGAWRGGEIRTLEPGTPRTRAQKLALLASLGGNLGLLAVFKYFHFLVDNWNAAAGALGLAGVQWHPGFTIALPLGISFYTFQTMSYTLDVYLGRTRATRHFLNYCTYVSLFPQLVAGPIVRYADVAHELQNRRVTLEHFASGAGRFTVGLAKKLLIANTVALPADRIFAMPGDHLTPELAWLAVVCYTLQIYFDFSGYSDMAIGMGRMFGFHFLENFNYPYASRSITEFWRRWHMSLSTWFRDYLYIPLGGNRRGPARTYVNLITVFFLCGLWHGAAWQFVFWGLYQGVFLCAERALAPRLAGRRVPVVLTHAYVMLVTMVGWVFFRAENMNQAFGFLEAMAGIAPGTGLVYNVGMFADREVWLAMAVGAVGSLPVLPWLQSRVQAWLDEQAARSGGHAVVAAETAWSAAVIAGIAVLFLLSAMELSSATHNPFIYFRF